MGLESWHFGRRMHVSQNQSPVINGLPRTRKRIKKAAAAICGWDCPLPAFIFPGFDCSSCFGFALFSICWSRLATWRCRTRLASRREAAKSMRSVCLRAMTAEVDMGILHQEQFLVKAPELSRTCRLPKETSGRKVINPWNSGRYPKSKLLRSDFPVARGPFGRDMGDTPKLSAQFRGLNPFLVS